MRSEVINTHIAAGTIRSQVETWLRTLGYITDKHSNVEIKFDFKKDLLDSQLVPVTITTRTEEVELIEVNGT